MPLKFPTTARPGNRASRTFRPPASLLAILALVVAACGGGGGGTGGDGAQLQMTVSGLPAGTPATVTITGPNGFNRSVTASGAITGLQPGTYAIAATGTENDSARYTPAPLSQSITLAEGESRPAQVAYAVSTGRIAVSISGLPQGVNGSVLVKRTPNFAQTLAASAILSKLIPGTYTITADTIASGGTTYPGTPYTRTVGVVASYTPVPAPVEYAPQPGALRVTVNGLPPTIPADITVTGPGGYNQVVTSTTTLQPLASGTYTVAAAAATSGGDAFNPAPPTQQVSVTTGAQSQATVTYASANGETLNLSIGRFYVTQSVQRPDNSVPLVAGRPALVRVFVVANEANSAQPQVRVRFFQGATQVSEQTIPPQVSGVPIAVTESDLSGSWDLELPAGFLAPGMTVEVMVDPANAIAESAESDNGTLPAGQVAGLDVRTTPAFNVTFVPIHENVPNRTGNVHGGNAEAFLSFLRRTMPVNSVTWEVHPPLSTDTTLSYTGTGWLPVLNRLDMARVAEGSSRYWYGVIASDCPPQTGCVAGIGFVEGAHVPSTAMGWDRLPSGSEVAAHEWGHNFGRFHVDCGGPNPGSIDPAYPYATTSTGQWGWDALTLALKDPGAHRDLMSYCDPQWMSDYTYNAIRAFRGVATSTQAPAPAEGILVWGRVEYGKVILEPAFGIVAPPSPDTGDWTVSLLDDAQRVIQTFRFATRTVADLPGEPSTFAFVLPLDQARRDRVAALRVSGPGGVAERRAAPLPPGARAAAPVPAVERAGNRTRLRWDPSRFGAALVRDAATGHVLGIVRDGGVAVVAGAAGDLDVTFSDGVRSARARVTR